MHGPVRCAKPSRRGWRPTGDCSSPNVFRRRIWRSRSGWPGFYLSTAHPAKFGEVISPVTGAKVPLPPRLAELVKRPRVSEPMAVDLGTLEEYVAGV